MPFRVLIVDDYPAIRRAVRSLLASRDDFEVCAEAENGAEGVERSAELKPDVVLLNISMPVMNGFEAARDIGVVSPRSRVVILSSETDKRLMEEARNVGAVSYVSKSDIDRDLIAAIEGAANGRSTVVW